MLQGRRYINNSELTMRTIRQTYEALSSRVKYDRGIRKVKKEGLEVDNFIFNPTVLAHCSNAVILVL